MLEREKINYPTAALAEARRIMTEMGQRDGDPWAEHKAAGIVREGIHSDTQITGVRTDGTLVELNVSPIAINNGEQTLFIPLMEQSSDVIELFSQRVKHV